MLELEQLNVQLQQLQQQNHQQRLKQMSYLSNMSSSSSSIGNKPTLSTTTPNPATNQTTSNLVFNDFTSQHHQAATAAAAAALVAANSVCRIADLVDVNHAADPELLSILLNSNSQERPVEQCKFLVHIIIIIIKVKSLLLKKQQPLELSLFNLLVCVFVKVCECEWSYFF